MIFWMHIAKVQPMEWELSFPDFTSYQFHRFILRRIFQTAQDCNSVSNEHVAVQKFTVPIMWRVDALIQPNLLHQFNSIKLYFSVRNFANG